MSGIAAEPEGITTPPIDELLERTDSKYSLVVYAARRARQINTYNRDVEGASGMFDTIGPLVPVSQEDKPLAVALREIQAGMLQMESGSPVSGK